MATLKKAGSILVPALLLCLSADMCEKKPPEQKQTQAATQATPPAEQSAPQASRPADSLAQKKAAADSAGILGLPPSRYAGIREVRNDDHFKRILDAAGSELLVFELYADWCVPCRILSPIMVSIAKDYYKKAFFYKANIDLLPTVAAAFGANAIPVVAFVKEHKGVYGFRGMQPREAYVKALDSLLAPAAAVRASAAVRK